MAEPHVSSLLRYCLMAAVRGLSQRTFWLLACYLFANAGAVASLPSSPANPTGTFARSVVASVGYETSWLERTRERAQRASRDNEPYLANRLWRVLAAAGDRDAAFRLGLYYDVSGGSQADARRAVYWYRRAALAGEMHAQHNLGVAYAAGKGVDMDIQEAIKWWMRAANQGNADSQYNLGILYAEGEYGIKRNLELAKHWWREAARHGDAMAQYNLGTLYVNNGAHDYCEATRLWREAAQKGVEQADLALRVIKRREDYRACQ